MVAVRCAGRVGDGSRGTRCVLSTLLSLVVLLASSAAGAAPICIRHAAAGSALARLQEAMDKGRFIAYQPSAFAMVDGRATDPDRASIRLDLERLRGRFDALVTYGALHGGDAIADSAESLGYRALVVGIWDPFDEREVDAALTAFRAHPQLVVGFAVGSEWLFAKRPNSAGLASRFAAIRAKAPSVALAASEPFHVFYEPTSDAVLSQSDFLLPNVHPVFQPWFRDAPAASAATFVTSVVDELAKRFCGPILVKETGVPTEPISQGFNAQRQSDFYTTLARAFPGARNRAFAYFAAFDAPWRVADEQAAPGFHPEEAHWGLYDAKRNAKPVVATIPVLATGEPSRR